jgi:hypothetical protein
MLYSHVSRTLTRCEPQFRARPGVSAVPSKLLSRSAQYSNRKNLACFAGAAGAIGSRKVNRLCLIQREHPDPMRPGGLVSPEWTRCTAMTPQPPKRTCYATANLLRHGAATTTPQADLLRQSSSCYARVFKIRYLAHNISEARITTARAPTFFASGDTTIALERNNCTRASQIRSAGHIQSCVTRRKFATASSGLNVYWPGCNVRRHPQRRPMELGYTLPPPSSLFLLKRA